VIVGVSGGVQGVAVPVPAASTCGVAITGERPSGSAKAMTTKTPTSSETRGFLTAFPPYLLDPDPGAAF